MYQTLEGSYEEHTHELRLNVCESDPTFGIIDPQLN